MFYSVVFYTIGLFNCHHLSQTQHVLFGCFLHNRLVQLPSSFTNTCYIRLFFIQWACSIVIIFHKHVFYLVVLLHNGLVQLPSSFTNTCSIWLFCYTMGLFNCHHLSQTRVLFGCFLYNRLVQLPSSFTNTCSIWLFCYTMGLFNCHHLSQTRVLFGCFVTQWACSIAIIFHKHMFYLVVLLHNGLVQLPSYATTPTGTPWCCFFFYSWFVQYLSYSIITTNKLLCCFSLCNIVVPFPSSVMSIIYADFLLFTTGNSDTSRHIGC